MNPLTNIFNFFFKKTEPDYIIYLRHEYRGKEFTVKVYRDKIDYYGKAEYRIRLSSIPWDIKVGYEEVAGKISTAFLEFKERINNEMMIGERENEMIRQLVDVQLQNTTPKINS